MANTSLTTFHDIWMEAVRKGMVPGKEKAARDWMREQGRKLQVGDIESFLKSDPWTKNFARRKLYPGFMYTYRYDAKNKNDAKKLPFWDAQPLGFIIEETADSVLFLNLHYLNRPMRGRLMDALHTIATNKRYNDNQRLALSYGVLKSSMKFKWFKPCVKTHLKSHIRSKFYKIDGSEWDSALFLNSEMFQRKPKTFVWADSAKKIREGK